MTYQPLTKSFALRDFDRPEEAEHIRRRHFKHVGNQPIKVALAKLTKSNTSQRPEQHGSTILSIVNTNDVDLDDEVVLPGGMLPDSYIFENKSLFVDHTYDTEHCVGAMRRMNVVKSGGVALAIKMQSHLVGNHNPFARMVRDLISLDVAGNSIGFIPVDYGAPTPEERKQYPKATSIVRVWDCMEVSFTPMPCSKRCRTVGMTDELDEEEVAKALAGFDERVLGAFGITKAPEIVKPRRTVVVVD